MKRIFFLTRLNSGFFKLGDKIFLKYSKTKQKGSAQNLKKIHLTVYKKLDRLPKKMNLALTKIIQKIYDFDKKGQIPLLPSLFTSSLKIPNKIKNDFLIKLGSANIFGWTAYTIFDDFFDDEGKAKTLPLANLCLRETITVYQNILDNNDFKSLVQKITDNIDSANFWEVTHCRNTNNLPDYGDMEVLANRSLGHVLGPIAILFKLGFNSSSPEIKNLISFFRHLLIARQLNDDLFDRDEDLKKNCISPVVSLTLKKSEKEAIKEINELIFFHLKSAEEKTKNLVHICEKDLFNHLISTILKTAEETRKTIEK